jgi:hypothetical protein
MRGRPQGGLVKRFEGAAAPSRSAPSQALQNGDVGAAQGIQVQGVHAAGWRVGVHFGQVFGEQGGDLAAGGVVVDDPGRGAVRGCCWALDRGRCSSVWLDVRPS